ncbi:MAG: HlyD family efflux transporter periplasmic adaptor subunit [Caulobacteraceae bacterium]
MSVAHGRAEKEGGLGLAAQSEPGPPRPGLFQRLRLPLMIIVPLLIVAFATWYALTSGRFESTDDAYVQRDKAPVSAAIAGRVIEIDVTENQHVAAGQVLFKLDPADEVAEASRAQAALASAKLQVAALQAALDQAKVTLASDQETQSYATREAARQRALSSAGVSSRQQLDAAAHAASLARSQVSLARQGVATALANLGAAAQNPALYPGVLQAGAQQQTSLINLSRTVVRAPVSGFVAQVSQLQVGAYVQPAQTVFYLLSGEPWVEANFKENQLKKMRVGQPATIAIDAWGGGKLDGYVQSFSPGSGASFSPLPAQNATGNWVKVVQRLPVRIAFKRTPPAAASRDGLSANVTVDVRRP